MNYRLVRCTTMIAIIAHAQMRGRKKDKVSLSYLVRADADGIEKFPFMIIGKSKRLLCFKKKSGQELGFDYRGGCDIVPHDIVLLLYAAGAVRRGGGPAVQWRDWSSARCGRH